MCGILGGYIRGRDPYSVPQLEAALAQLHHRGPDASNLYTGQGVFLGHTRLSIIDLDPRANQPMRRGNLRIVFNGEIYNYRELRAELQARGERFSTTSDTEVLLAAYRHFGKECLPRLEGMFAFAIWDEVDQSIFLARDRFGEKPLFYFRDGNEFLFASEIAPLRILLRRTELKQHREALGLYFLFSYIPAPHAPYESMAQLEPGCWVKFSAPTWSVGGARYYDLPILVEPGRTHSYAEAMESLRARLERSVRTRVATSDVPVATFLSGGIDSSIITSLAARSTTDSITAYSIGFPDDPEFDETSYATDIARKLSNVRHRVIPVSESGLADFIDSTLGKLSEPIADASLIPTAYLCSKVEEKVILGGDGADELFGGYGVYQAMRVSTRIPRPIKRALRTLWSHGNPHALRSPLLRAWNLFQRHVADSVVDEYLSWREYASPADVELLQCSTTLLEGIKKRLAFLEGGGLRTIQLADLLFNLPNDMLKKVDYASMQHSLEVRLPFLDSALVEWALSLPDHYKVHWRGRKRILRSAFRSQLPKSIVGRRKQGFLLPIRRWFRRGALNEQLREHLVRQNVIDPAFVRRKLSTHEAGREDNSVLLWSIFVYLRWLSA